MLRTLFAVIALAVFAPPGASAQAPASAAGAWYRVRYIKFKPGMAEDGKKMIYEHFATVDQAIGRQNLSFDAVTGEWSHIVFFPLPGGVDAKAEQAEDTRWMAALARQEGSAEKAQAIVKRFEEMIDRTQDEFVQRGR